MNLLEEEAVEYDARNLDFDDSNLVKLKINPKVEEI